MSEQMDKTLKEIWDSLTDEQKEKTRVCKTSEELAPRGKNPAFKTEWTMLPSCWD